MSKIKDKYAAQTESENLSAKGEEGNGATHRIAATPERGFWRCGRLWPREGVEVARSEFDDVQWAALEAEPCLSVDPLNQGSS